MYGTASGHATYGSVVAITALAAVGLYYALSGREEQVILKGKVI